MAQPTFQHRLRVVPTKPGVYLMKDAGDNVLYVGKASVLRNRLRSYFGSPIGLGTKIRRLVAQIADFEVIVTDSEAEALILENTLIKRYKPHYNARLKDDKTADTPRTLRAGGEPASENTETKRRYRL